MDVLLAQRAAEFPLTRDDDISRTDADAGETPDGADGWVDLEDRPESRADEMFRGPSDQLPVRARTPGPPEVDRDRAGPEPTAGPKAMAVLSHFSVLFGVPVFLVPILRRQHEFTVHHARAAAVTYLLFYGLLGLAFLNCGVFMPLALLAYIPALVGIVRAVEGRPAGRWGFGTLADKLIG